MESLIEETKQEIIDLKQELSECEENIKNATTEEERKEFLEEKEHILGDIADAEKELEAILELQKKKGDTTE
jgi:hypothetical protein